MAGSKPPPAAPGAPKKVARSAPDLDTKNTLVPSSRVLLVLDKPVAADDKFTLHYPPKTKGKAGRKKTLSQSDAVPIDADHVAVVFDEIAEDPKNTGRYELVQHRGKEDHTIFRNTNTQILNQAGGKSPQNRRKQFYKLAFHVPRSKDDELNASFPDFNGIVVKEPLTD